MLGWQACKDSGDRDTCTLPQFLRRVSDALKAKQRPPDFRALPSKQAYSRVVPNAFKRAAKEADELREQVDVERLAKALGVKPSKIRVKWPRRAVLRGTAHPAGGFDLGALWKAKGQAKQQGRSLYDLELELMAYNGWEPSDEDRVCGHMNVTGQSCGKDSGTTPFLDAWREAGLAAMREKLR